MDLKSGWVIVLEQNGDSLRILQGGYVPIHRQCNVNNSSIKHVKKRSEFVGTTHKKTGRIHDFVVSQVEEVAAVSLLDSIELAQRNK
jgi:hypothetical protein